ncbi:unnamed protein product [Adineta steineri]|uniref:Uncharacterized protein n=1 Tax=Adineta steineri TaxID=433720 RepID=A0A819TRJ5_9BILA|nr:unnamed protein product [Adineta steineri]CAF4091822.1 unnamed protein product [Adineta steineri]
MRLLIIFLLFAIVRTQQYPCSCSCCNGASCIPIVLSTVYAQSCTTEACLQQCRASYPTICQATPPYGQTIAQCISDNIQQYSCQCNCCNTGSPSCSTFYVGTSIAYTCASGSCSISCAQQYPSQCLNNQNGQTQGTCTGLITTTTTTTTSSTNIQQYNCRCDCCNTGSPSCSTSYVGTSIAYTCASGSCSISCAQQYPSQCLNNQHGQTQGTCTDLITTTTTTTTIDPWLGNTCSCMCCQSGSDCSPTYVGTTSAFQCLATACHQACQIRYPSVCPSYYFLGQTIGTCTSSTTSGTTRCACNCCGTSGCFNYDIRTNEGCTTCNSLCQSQSRCTNTYQVTQTCYPNNTKIFHP